MIAATGTGVLALTETVIAVPGCNVDEEGVTAIKGAFKAAVQVSALSPALEMVNVCGGEVHSPIICRILVDTFKMPGPAPATPALPPVPALTPPVPALTPPVPALTPPVPALAPPVPALAPPVPALAPPVPALTPPVPALAP